MPGRGVIGGSARNSPPSPRAPGNNLAPGGDGSALAGVGGFRRGRRGGLGSPGLCRTLPAGRQPSANMAASVRAAPSRNVVRGVQPKTCRAWALSREPR